MPFGADRGPGGGRAGLGGSPAAPRAGRDPSAAGCTRRVRRGPWYAGAAACPLLALALLALPAAAQTGTGQARPAAGSAPVSEPSMRELAERIEGLERRLGTSALIGLVTRLDRLAREIQQLRDRIEVQGHVLDDLRDRQQDLYAELDRMSRRVAPPAPVPGDVAGRAPAAESASRAGTGPLPDPASLGEGGASEEEAGPASEPGGGDAEPGAPPADPPGSAGGAAGYDPVEEQSRYQLAFDLLSEGYFEQAAAAFAEFRADFPDSRYRDDAWFWQGECLYALRRFGPALLEFQALADNHADSPRAPGARLKIGFILHELGRSEEAAEVLEALVEAVPDSSEAKLARDRLERLK